MAKLDEVRKVVNEVVSNINYNLDDLEPIEILCNILNVLYRAKHNMPYVINSDSIFDNARESGEYLPIFSDEPMLQVDRLWGQYINNWIYKLLSLNHDDYSAIYPEIVDKVIINSGYVNSSDYFHPQSLSKLVISLVNSKKVKTLYNPFAGIGSYAIGFQGVYYGQEEDVQVRLLGLLRMDAFDIHFAYLKKDDSIANWDSQNAECIVSTPPFGAKIGGDYPSEFIGMTYDEYVINQFLKSNSTYAYFVVPRNFCNQNACESFSLRKDISEKGYLEMVISLPAGIFVNTGIATSLIVLNKKRGVKEPVRFIDAQKLYFSKNRKEKELDVQSILNLVHDSEQENCALIRLEEIRDYDYNWGAELYISRKNEIIPDGFQVVEFHEIAEPIRQNRTNSETEGHLVTIAQLSTDVTDIKRTPESFELSDNLRNAYKLEEPALLLSRIGVLKPTYCYASAENPVFVHPNVKAFRIIAEWVNPSYLCLELSKQNNLVVGAIIPHINLDQILRIRMFFPSIEAQQSYEEQGRLYNEFVYSSKLAKAREIGLQEVIDKKKSEYMIEVRNRKHDMKTPMTQLRNTLTLLEAFANKLPEESAIQLHNYISRQKVALDTLSEIVRHLADEDVFSEPEVLDIETILSSFACKNEKYSIVYVPDSIALTEVVGKEKAKVHMGKSDLLRLINNIIENAVNHGFVENKSNYELMITLSIEGDSYLIDFTNNGKPLPKGMDKARYGMKGVKGKDSEGQGTGGYVVKSIVEHYGGDYDVFTREWAGKTLTDVIVKLPIYLEDEQIQNPMDR